MPVSTDPAKNAVETQEFLDSRDEAEETNAEVTAKW